MFRSIFSRRKILTVFLFLFIVFIAFSIQTKTVAAQEHTSLVFEDDFEDMDIKDWQFSSQANGVSDIIQDGDNAVLSMTDDLSAHSLYGDKSLTDYTFESKIKALIITPFIAQMEYRLTDNGYYLAQLATNRITLFKNSHTSAPVELIRADSIFFTDKWYTIRMVGQGNNIKVFVDDELKIDYTDNDSPFLKGEFGFQSLEDSHIYVDDVKVYTTPPTTTPAPTTTVPPTTIVAVQEHAKLIFEEDFEDGKIDGMHMWGISYIPEPPAPRGDYEIIEDNGNNVLSEVGGLDINFGSDEWTDYTIETRIKVIKMRDYVIIRLKHTPVHIDHYYLQFDMDGIQLGKYTGTGDELDYERYSFSIDRWYDFKIEMVGNRIKVFIDEKLILEGIDLNNPLTSGHFGLGVKSGTTAYFDDVKVFTSSTSTLPTTTPVPTTTTPPTTTPAPTTTAPPTTTPAPTTTAPPTTTPAPKTRVPVDVSGTEVVDSDGDGWSDELEKRIGSNPFQQDSDGDGIIDSKDPNPLKYGGEMGTDSDGDGWSDELEEKAGTDPFEKDTDGDGMWDSKDPNPLIPQGQENGINWEALGVGLAVIAATGGWIVTNRKKNRMKRLLDDIDKTYEDFKMNSRRCEAELYKHRSVVSEQLKNGKIDEESYSILDKRLDDYLREIKQRIMEEKLPPKCPSCGSPFQGKDGDKCEYCGSVISREENMDK